MEKSDREKVILAGVLEASEGVRYEDFLHSMDELAELALACGKEPVERFVQTLDRRTAALYMGSGKVEEIKAAVGELNAVKVIFNDTLTPIQIRNLQKELNAEVIDRTALILEIFQIRARTREAKLQVELARLAYMKPRLIGMWEKQNRQGGASGAMSSKGEGETQLEIDRRTIDHRIADLKRELKVVERERLTQRKKRKASGLPLVSLVGYTNAGKSTIMNAFVKKYGESDKQVFEADMLFATLDTTVRKIKVKRREDFLLSDTVGFIQKLPTGLVEAFKSTLEDVKEADLILHVVDYSDERFKEQMETTNATIAELDAGDAAMLVVYNKCDLRTDTEYPRRGPALRSGTDRLNGSVFISAASEQSIEALSDAILDMLYGEIVEEEIFFPYSKGGEMADVISHSEIISSEYTGDGVKLRLRRRKK